MPWGFSKRKPSGPPQLSERLANLLTPSSQRYLNLATLYYEGAHIMHGSGLAISVNEFVAHADLSEATVYDVPAFYKYYI
jgi:hypothetical protein